MASKAGVCLPLTNDVFENNQQSVDKIIGGGNVFKFPDSSCSFPPDAQQQDERSEIEGGGCSNGAGGGSQSSECENRLELVVDALKNNNRMLMNAAADERPAFVVRKTLSLQNSMEKNDDEDDDDEKADEDEGENNETSSTSSNEDNDDDDELEGDRWALSSSRSPPVEFEYINGMQYDRKVSEQVSEVIALRYKLEPLRFEVECELGPVTEYANDEEEEEAKQHQENLNLLDLDESRIDSPGSGCFPLNLNLDRPANLHLDIISSPLSPPPFSPLACSPLSPSKSLKPDLFPICTIGTGAFGRVELCRHRHTSRYYALKTMNIRTIISRKQIQHVHQEKRILHSLAHPFIVRMYDTAKDGRNLYMIMEFLSGGELFSYLRVNRGFPSSIVKFYAAEVLLALEYLHERHIAYRDLKPENLMLTHTGHIKLTDFGFAKIIHNKSFTLCGTPTYLAPEIYARKGHNQTADFWALGVLIFELMTGRPPFRGHGAQDVQLVIEDQKGRPVFPHKTFSSPAKDIICRLLMLNPKERLGSKSAREVKDHIWFDRYDWNVLYRRNYKPPLVPKITHEGDTSNFDDYGDPPDQWPVATQGELDLFDDW